MSDEIRQFIVKYISKKGKLPAVLTWKSLIILIPAMSIQWEYEVCSGIGTRVWYPNKR